MATVTGFTSARMLQIENASVVTGAVQGDNLILTTRGGTNINAGNVRGPQGATGPTGPVSSINGQTGATYSPRIFANKAALDAWTTAPRGAIGITTDTDTQWEKGATVWFPSTGPRIFTSTTDLTTNWPSAVEGSKASTVDSDVGWYKSPLGWNIDNGVRVFADAIERDNRWPFPPSGSLALTLNDNFIWQRRSGSWQRPWNLPWGTQYFTQWDSVSGSIGGTAAAIPGYSVLLTSPGSRLMEIATTLSIWNTGGVTTELVAEYRPSGGGAGIGQAATTAYVNLTTHLKVSAIFAPPVSNNRQYDLFCWCASGGSIQLYAQVPARPATTVVNDLGPDPGISTH